MTKINLESNIYLYGTYYDPNRVSIPKEEHNWTGIIIYRNPESEIERKICSLKGYFLSKENIFKNLLCKKDQMKEFEEKYKGKFIPFENER